MKFWFIVIYTVFILNKGILSIIKDIYYNYGCRILSHDSLYPYPRIIKISVMLGTSTSDNKGGISMEEIKRGFQTANKYDTESYYEGLLSKYNPDNSLIKVIKANNNQQLVQEVLQIISRFASEPVSTIRDEYSEDIDCYWKGQGEYLIQCINGGLFYDVLIMIEKL